MKSKLNGKKILLFSIVLLSVLPTWFQIGGHMAISLMLPVILFFYLLEQRILQLNFIKYTWSIIIWLLIRGCICMSHGEYVRTITLSLTILLSIFILASYVDNEVKFINAIDIILYVSVAVCLLGIVEGIIGNNLFLTILNTSNSTIIRNVERLGVTRIIGFTTQTTHYALYMGMVSLLTVYRLSLCRTRRKKFRFYVIYVLQIINMFMTTSRTALLCYTMCVLFLLIKQGVRKLIIYMAILGIILASFMLLFDTSFIGQTIYMLLGSVFPGFLNLVSGVAEAERNNAIGDRLRLYVWVYNNLKGHLLLGVGEKTEFAQKVTIVTAQYSYTAIKNSIEVQYLNNLYHLGIIGMLAETIMYAKYWLISFKKRNSGRLSFENQYNFDFILMLILFFNLISYLAIMQGEEAHTLYLIIGLWIVYRTQLQKKKLYLEE